MHKKIFLIDGSGFIYRAYYAVRAMETAQGLQTNAIVGFHKMLNALIEEHQPDYLAVIFDRSRAELFRTRLYPEYKAKRKDMPEDLAVQIPYIKQLVRAMNLPALEVPEYEADDVIATLARRFATPETPVTIVSGDKDLMQSVTASVSHYDAMKKNLSREAEVVEKFGVAPHLIPDILGLQGDTSDNIPGVEGIGQKTATQLIQKFGSLEKLLSNPDKVSGEKRQRNLQSQADLARLSKDLATVRYDAPLDLALDQLRRPEQPNLALLLPLLEELEMTATASAYQPTEEGVVEIYTDGSGMPDGSGGYGVVLRFGEYQKELSGADPQTTSQRMELTAAIKGLEALKGPQAVHLVSDSQYLVKGMNEWLKGWEESGRLYHCDKLANKDLWQQLKGLAEQHTVRWSWVKGHSGHHFNERCDQLAAEAIKVLHLTVSSLS